MIEILLLVTAQLISFSNSSPTVTFMKPSFRFLARTSQLSEILKSDLADFNPKFSGEMFNFSLDLGNPKRIVTCVTIRDTSELTLQNELEINKISFQELELEDEKKRLRPYITAFAKRTKQILNDDLKIKNEIFKTLKSVKTSGEVKVLSVELVDSIILIELEESGLKSKIEVRFEGKVIVFRTLYFTKSFQISMPTVNFIRTQVAKVFRDLLLHFKRLKVFTGRKQDRTLSKLQCQDIYVSRAGALLKSNFPKIEFPTISGNGSDRIPIENFGTLTCEDVITGTFNHVLLRFDFAGGILQPITRPLIMESMYDMIPVVESYFEELSTLIHHVFFPKNEIEDISDFSTEDEYFSMNDNSSPESNKVI